MVVVVMVEKKKKEAERKGVIQQALTGLSH